MSRRTRGHCERQKPRRATPADSIHGVLVGLIAGHAELTRLSEVYNRTKALDVEMVALAELLAE